MNFGERNKRTMLLGKNSMKGLELIEAEQYYEDHERLIIAAYMLGFTRG